MIKTNLIPESEFSEVFLQGMIDRMTVSHHKYGKVKDAFPHKINAIATMRKCIGKYHETGNKDYLIDAANYLMIEFMHPSIEGAKLESTEITSGRIDQDGQIRLNTPNDELY